jgi:hypothetical protein
MASRTQDEQKVILGALAVFDDDQNGVEPPYACLLINFLLIIPLLRPD